MREVAILLLLLPILTSSKTVPQTSFDILQISSKPSNLDTFKNAKQSSSLRINEMNDTILQSLEKILTIANTKFKENDLFGALELYNNFIKLSESSKYVTLLLKKIEVAYARASFISSSIGLHDKAIMYLMNATRLSFKYDQSNNNYVFSLLFNIGLAHSAIYDYENAISFYNTAEDYLTGTDSEKNRLKSTLLNNKGLCALKIGQTEAAESYLNQSIEIKKETNDFDDLGVTFNNIALIHQSQKNFSKARYFLQKSLELNFNNQNTENAAFVLNNIGNLFLELGVKDSAIYYYTKSKNLREKNTKTDITDLIVSYNNLSYVHSLLDNYDEAINFNNKALYINKDKNTQDKNHKIRSIPHYLTTISDQLFISYCRHEKEGKVDHLKASYDLFLNTIPLLIDELTQLNSLRSSSSFLHDNKRLFDIAVLIAYELDSIQPTPVPKTYIVSETFKSLSQINLNNELINYNNNDTATINAIQANNYYLWQELLTLKDFSTNTAQASVIIDSILDFTLDKINFRNKKIIEIRADLKTTIERIENSIIGRQRKLGGKLTIDYYLTEEALYINTITDTIIRTKKVILPKDFSNIISEYRRSITLFNEKRISQLNIMISAVLLTPIIDQILSQEGIIFIPDELLSTIPFESLVVENNKKTFYLIESNVISYRFSFLAKTNPSSQFKKKYKYDYLGISSSYANNESSEGLELSIKEIVEIEKAFQQKNLKTISLCDSLATIVNLLKTGFDSKIIHFSTHSLLFPQNSQLSFLELFPDHGQNHLYLPIFSMIPVHCELLFLNCCETNKNLIENSSGFISFLKNSSSLTIINQIGTLWKVIDKPSLLFSVRFFNYLNKGFDYSSALTLTKRDFIKQTEFSNPFFWAVYVLYESK